jgi:cytochrome o ubiquinol oxidase operon protein cyoD
MSVEGDLDLAPGYESQSEEGAGREGVREGVRSYVLGLALAIALTVASFWVARTHILYGPSIPVALVALAVAQMGIHLVFFLHITTAPDNTNNVLALALGILIVFVLVFGTVWVMAHMNHNMMPHMTSMEAPLAAPSPQNE